MGLRTAGMKKCCNEMRMNAEEDEGEFARPINETTSLFGPGVQNLWVKKTRGVRAGLKGANKTLPVAITSRLGEAHMAYISGDYDYSKQIFEEVVTMAPKLADPYLGIGLIYEECGDRKAALMHYKFAVKYSPRNADLLLNVAYLSRELGEIDDALSAINRAINIEKRADLFAEKILILVEHRAIMKADKALSQLLSHYPHEYSFLLDYGSACHSHQYYFHAVKSFSLFVKSARLIADIPLSSQPNPERNLVDTCHQLFFACRSIAEICMETTIIDLSPGRGIAPPSLVVRRAEFLQDMINTYQECSEFASKHGFVSWKDLPLDFALVQCVNELEAVAPGSGSGPQPPQGKDSEDGNHHNTNSNSNGTNVNLRRPARPLNQILPLLFSLLSSLSKEEKVIQTRLSDWICKQNEGEDVTMTSLEDIWFKRMFDPKKSD
jgi:Tfp pilus assembly protein PilF